MHHRRMHRHRKSRRRAVVAVACRRLMSRRRPAAYRQTVVAVHRLRTLAYRTCSHRLAALPLWPVTMAWPNGVAT
jgi:hypothetical protein